MKGSAITGPVAKECVRAHLLRSYPSNTTLTFPMPGGSLASYCIERGYCRMSFICLFACLSSVSHSTPYDYKLMVTYRRRLDTITGRVIASADCWARKRLVRPAPLVFLRQRFRLCHTWKTMYNGSWSVLSTSLIQIFQRSNSRLCCRTRRQALCGRLLVYGVCYIATWVVYVARRRYPAMSRYNTLSELLTVS